MNKEKKKKRVGVLHDPPTLNFLFFALFGTILSVLIGGKGKDLETFLIVLFVDLLLWGLGFSFLKEIIGVYRNNK